MKIMKPATVIRAFRLAATGSGQDRCHCRERSQDHKPVHHSRLISWARMTIHPGKAPPSLSRRDCQQLPSISSTMTSTTAMLSFSVPPSLRQRPCPGARRKLVAPPNLSVSSLRKPSNQSLSIGCLCRSLLGAGSPRGEDAGAHEARRCRTPPSQLSSRVCVATVSTCSPKRFIWTFIIASWVSSAGAVKSVGHEHDPEATSRSRPAWSSARSIGFAVGDDDGFDPRAALLLMQSVLSRANTHSCRRCGQGNELRGSGTSPIISGPS